MDADSLLRRLESSLKPSHGQKERVFGMVRQRLPSEEALKQVGHILTPSKSQKQAVWARIGEQLSPSGAVNVLDKVRAFLTATPAQTSSLRASILERLTDTKPSLGLSFFKWTAAFAVVMLVLRASPFLFLAPHTIAESSVLILPTRGSVLMLQQGLWQQVYSDLRLTTGSVFRTEDGEATVIFNDDGNARLDANTQFTLNDVSDRPEALGGPTITLESGRVWLQAFVPFHLTPITIQTPQGTVALHAGSASVQVKDDSTTVRVWDRHATVALNGEEIILVAGEWADMRGNHISAVHAIPERDQQEAWVAQNLTRDAVHRRELAQKQTEERAARAGILPNSPLYAVKRVAEQVDVLLTFDEHSKVQKRLDQATTRLDEAAALITRGQSGSELPLEEFRTSLLAIASGTGENLLTQSLIRQEVAENTAALAATRPDDESYPLKVALLETSAELPVDSGGVDAKDVQSTFLTDSVDSLQDSLKIGDIEKAAELYENLRPQVELMRQDASLLPEVRKEILTSLENAQQALEGVEEGVVAEDAVRAPEKVPAALPALTPEQREVIALKAFNAIAKFNQPRPRLNQLVYETKRWQLEYPKEYLQLLQHLYRLLPKQDALSVKLRQEIQDARTNS